jgi:hypothetical protein
MKKDSRTKREEEIARFLKANQIIQKAERHEQRKSQQKETKKYV